MWRFFLMAYTLTYIITCSLHNSMIFLKSSMPDFSPSFRPWQPQLFEKISYMLLSSVCVWCVCVCLSSCATGHLCGVSSHLPIVWTLGIESRLPGMHDMYLYLRSHLAGPTTDLFIVSMEYLLHNVIWLELRNVQSFLINFFGLAKSIWNSYFFLWIDSSSFFPE